MWYFKIQNNDKVEIVIMGLTDWNRIQIKVSGDEEVKNQEASILDVYSTCWE